MESERTDSFFLSMLASDPAVAVALLRTAAQDALGPDWARDENLAEDAVPAFLLKNCDVRWVDA